MKQMIQSAIAAAEMAAVAYKPAAAEAIKDDAQRASLLRTAISYERMAHRLESARNAAAPRAARA